jgi:hypothetical protein
VHLTQLDGDPTVIFPPTEPLYGHCPQWTRLKPALLFHAHAERAPPQASAEQTPELIVLLLKVEPAISGKEVVLPHLVYSTPMELTHVALLTGHALVELALAVPVAEQLVQSQLPEHTTALIIFLKLPSKVLC